MQIKAAADVVGYPAGMSQISLLSASEPGALKLIDAAQVSDAGIVSRTVLQTPEARITLFTFAEGQELTEHTNRRRALVQVIEGACEFMAAGHWQRLEPGTLLHLPPNAPHALRATCGPCSMLLTLCAETAA
jgi:quercetin dioxygenase-like cupin family protein